jgi:hypothetical protein
MSFEIAILIGAAVALFLGRDSRPQQSRDFTTERRAVPPELLLDVVSDVFWDTQ